MEGEERLHGDEGRCKWSEDLRTHWLEKDHDSIFAVELAEEWRKSEADQ